MMKVVAMQLKADRYAMLCRDVSLLLDQSWGVKEPGPSSSVGSGRESEGSEEDVSIV